MRYLAIASNFNLSRKNIGIVEFRVNVKKGYVHMQLRINQNESVSQQTDAATLAQPF